MTTERSQQRGVLQAMPPYCLEERHVVLGETFVGRQCGHGYAMIFLNVLQLLESKTKEAEVEEEGGYCAN